MSTRAISAIWSEASGELATGGDRPAERGELVRAAVPDPQPDDQRAVRQKERGDIGAAHVPYSRDRRDERARIASSRLRHHVHQLEGCHRSGKAGIPVRRTSKPGAGSRECRKAFCDFHERAGLRAAGRTVMGHPPDDLPSFARWSERGRVRPRVRECPNQLTLVDKGKPAVTRGRKATGLIRLRPPVSRVAETR